MQTQQAVDRFLVAKKPTWKAATYTNRRYHLTHFAKSCPDLPTEPEPIEAFLATIPGLLYRYHHWCSIRYFYNWAARRLSIHENPCPLVEAPAKPKPKPYYLEEEDLPAFCYTRATSLGIERCYGSSLIPVCVLVKQPA